MAVDEISKRQNIASKAVTAATALVDALNSLLDVKTQRDKLVSPFVDSDFTGTALKQIDAAMIGQLFDFVIPSLQTNYLDVANSGRNQQILLQVRS